MNYPIGGNPWQKFGSLGWMETDQGWAHLRRGNHSNPSPHNIPPRGGPLAFFFRGRSTNNPRGGNPWQNFGSLGQMDTDQGRAQLCMGNHNNPSLHNTPPRGGTPSNFFPRPGHKFSHRGETLAKCWVIGADGHRSGSGAPVQGQPQKSVTAQHPPLGGPL